MFNDLDAMELLCRGHALEWTGQCWKVALQPEKPAIISYAGKQATDVTWLVGAPTVASETHIVCVAGRTAALLRDNGANRGRCRSN